MLEYKVSIPNIEYNYPLHYKSQARKPNKLDFEILHYTLYNLTNLCFDNFHYKTNKMDHRHHNLMNCCRKCSCSYKIDTYHQKRKILHHKFCKHYFIDIKCSLFNKYDFHIYLLCYLNNGQLSITNMKSNQHRFSNQQCKSLSIVHCDLHTFP